MSAGWWEAPGLEVQLTDEAGRPLPDWDCLPALTLFGKLRLFIWNRLFWTRLRLHLQGSRAGHWLTDV